MQLEITGIMYGALREDLESRLEKGGWGRRPEISFSIVLLPAELKGSLELGGARWVPTGRAPREALSSWSGSGKGCQEEVPGKRILWDFLYFSPSLFSQPSPGQSHRTTAS